MIEEQKALIKLLIVKSITKEEFMNKFGVNNENMIQFITKNLEKSYEEKNAEEVGLLLYIIFEYDLFSEQYVDILCKLLYSKWHYEHENIAMIFDKLKSANTIKALYDTASTKFEYLDYDDSYALAVKCIWGLGKMNTNESKEALEKLTKSDIEVISKNAKEQLAMRKFDRIV